jgi:hypothetical protein
VPVRAKPSKLFAGLKLTVGSRLSPSLKPRLSNSQCVVRAAAIEDDNAEVLNWLPQVRCKSVDHSKELLRVAVRDDENRQLFTSI